MRDKLRIASLAKSEVRACDGQRESTIRSASYFFCVVVILAIVFPVAHLTNLEAASF